MHFIDLHAQQARLKDEIEKRNAIAKRYSDALKSHVTQTPEIKDGVISTWAQYTMACRHHAVS